MIFLIIILILFFFVFLHLKNKKFNFNQNIYLPYIKKDYLMTKAEMSFFRVLESVIESEYYIVPQLTISKIVLTTAKGKNYYSYLSKINKKTVDFVLFDKKSFSPVMVIELDDNSHLEERRKQRDLFVDNVMKEIGLEIIHIKAAYNYNLEEVRDLIFQKNNINEDNS